MYIRSGYSANGVAPSSNYNFIITKGRVITIPSGYRELNGISAIKYLEKVRKMFLDMELHWDLDELDKIVPSR